MEKIIARYFYSPICTESYATLNRLKKLFNIIEEYVQFESFNTTEVSLESKLWFSTEKELLLTIKGTGVKPLNYNKLFIAGKEIKGFPPSKKMIEEVLNQHNISYPEDIYITYYKEVIKHPWDISKDKICIKKYQKENLFDVCLVCTKHNPFLHESDYIKENWCKYENEKKKYIYKKLHEENMLGFVAYYNNQPVGIIEAYPLSLASKLGFPVTNINENGIMITCLNIRKEVSGNGISSMLIKEMINEALNNKYQAIEVLAFPDEFIWQPISLYQKHGFKAVKDVNDLKLMKIIF